MKSYKLRRKRGLAVAMAGAVLVLGLMMSTVCVKAETGTGTVKGTSVNVRNDAGTNATRICSLGNGAALIVTGSKKDAAGNVWYAVSFMQNGKNYAGYIMSDYVNYKPAETAKQNDNSDATDSTTSAAKWKAEVTATNVNVRKKAVTGNVVGQVTTGATVTVSKEKTASDGKVWYYISFQSDGATKKGWIRSDFVKKIQTNSDTSSSDSSNETQNDKTQNTSQDGIPQIDVSGAIDTSGTGTNTEQKKETASKRKAVMNGDFVRVRKSPVTGAVVCQLNKGVKLTIKKEKKGADGYVWYKVSFKYNGKTKSGYVRSDFVKITEETKSDSTKEDDKKKESDDKVEIIKKGTVTGDNVRVRKSPVTGEEICRLMRGDALIVKDEKKGSDDKVWYQAVFTYDGAEKNGYIRSDFVKVTEETVVKEEEDSQTEEENESNMSADVDFEAYLTEQGFPESYKDSLRSLHSAHPEWVFRTIQTGLNWEDVIAAEGKVGTNLVAKNAITSWKSTEKTAYNWNTDSWYTFDGGAWVAASKELVAYYLDPRNFLTDDAIFQFESLEYEEYHSKDGVKRLLKDTFMSGKFTEPDGTKKSYASTFVKIGKKTGVSPYHLAARCYQEQGKGTSGSVTGTTEGYKDIFNYYNIGAYASGGNSPVIQGLKYASVTSANEASNYSRPWDTRYKSLLGGAQFIAQKYIKAGQNTLYFQKFNVVPTKSTMLYKHQYMTNIQAAEAEAMKMSKAYTAEDKKLVFYIPVYNQMPEAACAKPTSNSNPNNYLATLEIEGYNLLPVFNPGTATYDLTVPKKVKKVTVSAAAIASTATVEGTGKVKLKRGKNEVKITCTAENGAIKTYTIYIVRE